MKNSVLRFELLLLLLLVAHDKLFHQARLGGHPLKNLYQGIGWNINCWHLNPKRPFHSHFYVLFILAIVAHTYVCCHSVVRVHSSCFSAVRSSFHNAGCFYWLKKHVLMQNTYKKIFWRETFEVMPFMRNAFCNFTSKFCKFSTSRCTFFSRSRWHQPLFNYIPTVSHLKLTEKQ